MANKGQFTADNQPKKRGRPKGTRSKLNQIIDSKRPELIDLAFSNAMNQEHEHQLGWAGICAKLCPPPRTTMPTFQITSTGNIKEDAKVIAQAMNNGEISPDQAQAALAVCRDSVTIVEIQDIETLLDKLLAER